MVSFEEAFEQTGHGVFNYVVLATCGLVLMYTNVESLGIGYVMAAAECDLKLSSTEKGMANAAAFIGIVSTAIFWGYLSDQYGRRAIMLPAIASSCIASFASSFATNFLCLFCLRFFTGCLVSASSATVYAYLGEMHSNERRSRAIAFSSSFISFTFVAVPLLAWVIMAGTWSFHLAKVKVVPWRVFMWSWCIPGIVAAIILVILPESPRFLFSAYGQDSTIPVLAKIYAWNTKKKKEEFPVRSISHMSPTPTAQRGFCSAFHNIRLLLRPPLIKCVLLSHISMFMVFLLSSGMYTWMPIMLNEMLFKIGTPVNMCTIMNEKEETKTAACQRTKIHALLYPVSVIMGMVCAVTYVSIGYIMAKYNKICIYCWLLIVCSLMLLASSLVPQLVVALLLLISGLASGCSAAVLAAIAVEVFPTSVRALALCTLYMSGRLGAAVGANLLGVFLQKNCVEVLLSNTLLTAASALLMILWPDPKAVRSQMEAKGYVY